MIGRADITGLVLAGGRGQRMGGVDKGLQLLRGTPLALVALERLRPQVAGLMVSANRHLDTYRGFGAPVLMDEAPDHPGPLAGMLAGLRHASTAWLLTVPCDTPAFPPDLADRLARAVTEQGADVAMAATLEAGRVQPQPVFCLVRRTLEADLAAFIAEGGASPRAWAARHRTTLVPFDDAGAFANANTLADLQRLQ
ncbi:molybdenum cofactor guanylyltransferase MobA [Piscinibacter gummiphilus]|uniref:Molybdenum cofactor guanylyltransferase n=1 Tax=Piscinibacter gummiphilus TaxID=946333 RepID=A0A1W6LAR2_9BURK|nr:molybdenum cofactor guanylyltransferase MobA [Piscinibacter gummiphilus]ARN21287.1 molybdenum cofactor guanylyltransferase MobA [Piscinibacter gummiphilus]ATU65973.1 molybdenum cofactor guanylyltransferase MobA [Piscinibacter gummiphilus]GLS93855.1 molybdenum cofactor guanylyltransferase [Piscinibacter gummiphilus]